MTPEEKSPDESIRGKHRDVLTSSDQFAARKAEARADDYFAVVAEVVEASRRASEARGEYERASEAATDASMKRRAAEKELDEALERLRQTDTGRNRGPS